MTNVAITGASGKMGQTLIQSVIRHQTLTLSAAIDQSQSAMLGQDAAQFSASASGIQVADDLNKAEFDVLVDFTRPEATLSYLDVCVQRHKPMVIGTTGFSDQQMQLLGRAAESIAIVQAPNMSLGVNLCLKLMEIAAQALAEEADIEIIEAHHKHKVDAPSGTALAMGQVIARQLGRDLQQDGVFVRHGHTGPRQREQIGFSVIRAGDIIGDHTALFALDGERVEVTHKASSRDIYAHGALKAAGWVVDQSSPGLYNMQNVLGFG